jgi:hypothetical protein
MLEINDEANLSKDDIKTKEGYDYKTNNGYILGTPFIHSFNIILDFDQNRIGFANKIRGFGSEITGQGAPGGRNEESKPDDGDTKPDDEDTKPDDGDTTHDDDKPIPDDEDSTDVTNPTDLPKERPEPQSPKDAKNQ